MKPAELSLKEYASVILIAFDWPAIRGFAEAKWVYNVGCSVEYGRCGMFKEY